MTDLLWGMEQEKKKGPFHLMIEGCQVFKHLKQEFMEPPVLRHFDYHLPTLVVTDVSQYTVAAILLQSNNNLLVEPQVCDWHPVVYYSWKLHDAKHWYEIHDQELLSIIKAFKQWQHYLLENLQPVRIQTDHANLRYFFTTKILNQWQAHWAELLTVYDFIIKYKLGKQNPTNALSRQRDYQPTQYEASGGMLPMLQWKLSHGMYVHCLVGE